MIFCRWKHNRRQVLQAPGREIWRKNVDTSTAGRRWRRQHRTGLMMENSGLWHTFSHGDPQDSSQPSPTFSDMPSRVLDGGIAVDVGKQTEAKPLGVVRRVRVTVDNDRSRSRVEHLTDAVVQLVVRDRRPVPLLLVRHRLHVYSE